jgi:outer membrane protein TolC
MSWRGFVLAGLFWPFFATANEEPLSLTEAVARALQIAPQVQARAANVDAMRAASVSAGRLRDPELIVGIDNLPVTGPDAYSTTSDFMTMRKVGVMQEFSLGTKRRLLRERAEADASRASAELVDTRLEVARTVAELWIRRATAESSANALQTLKPEVELQAAAARAAVSAGRSSTADALAAEASVAQLTAELLKLDVDVQRARSELRRWIDIDASRPLAGLPSFDELPTPPAALLSSVTEHASILPLEAQIAAARIDVDLARAQRRPDWSAELAYAKRGSAFSDMVSIEFRVGLPLFAGNRQNPMITARHAEMRRVEAERDAEVRMHTAELEQTISDWQLLGKQVEQYERELLPLARERSRAALASYRAGRGDLRGAIEAHTQEVDFIREHASLQNDRGRAWAYLRYLGPQHLHATEVTP